MKALGFIKELKDRICLWNNLLSCLIYDFRYFYNVSNVKRKRNTRDQKLGSLIGSYHIIEKGLSMPMRRLGFGIPALSVLIDECKDYYYEYGNDSNQFLHAVQVVFEYEKLHNENGFDLPEEIVNKINNLHTLISIDASQQISLTKDEFFQFTESPFDLFSSSRHSTRHFSGNINKESVLKAIQLAQNAPSSCNKQPTNVHLVLNKELVKEILLEQRGNRGFGQNINSILVLTTNMSCYSQVGERHSGYVDLGIYAMNLLYSLHFYKVGAIPLVWLSNRERNTWLNTKLGIPNSEIPVLIIGIGCVSDNTTLVCSPRKGINEVLTLHE